MIYIFGIIASLRAPVISRDAQNKRPAFLKLQSDLAQRFDRKRNMLQCMVGDNDICNSLGNGVQHCMALDAVLNCLGSRSRVNLHTDSSRASQRFEEITAATSEIENAIGSSDIAVKLARQKGTVRLRNGLLILKVVLALAFEVPLRSAVCNILIHD